MENTFGIAHLSVISVRARPSKRSELVSQLLFGEIFQVLEEEENWLKIQCIWDGQKGWVDQEHFLEITDKDVEKLKKEPAFALEITQAAMAKDYYLPLLIGSTLPNYDGINLKIKNKRYTYSGQAVLPHQLQPTAELAIRIARKFLYAPECLGGRTPFGIDAPGLSQIVFKMMNIQLPRTAAKQAQCGKVVDFVSEAQSGDVAFFESNRNITNHVGIILPDSQIIHVSGKVRIDRLDHFGIFNIENNRYTHKLRVVKRLL